MKEPKVHLLHEEQMKLFTEFLQCFVRPEVLADNSSPKKLKTVDVQIQHLFC
ncbi:hypothetical protein SNE40_018270 [Patella caerulea]|uniref:Uncharacterized protein n=1 Tax=Patella caerulea TaxID=87958 RepID=A0AAN8JAQ0_PATCE